jgi:hypothetical protein
MAVKPVMFWKTEYRPTSEHFIFRRRFHSRIFILCALHQTLFGVIKKNKMDGACSTYGGESRCTQGFSGET